MILKSDAGGRTLVPLDRQVELVREFERKFARLHGVKEAVAVSSGTDALACAELYLAQTAEIAAERTVTLGAISS